ncbi:hypothetical protein DFH09DRAFT_851776, partial [Mycena vulgaris]
VLKSKAAWRKQMPKWQEEARDAEEGEGSAVGDDDDEDEDEDLPAMITVSAAPRPRRARSWLPITLANLFGGTISRPLGKPARRSRVVSEEGLYMELLAAKYSNDEPDAGALEAFGDDFEE